MHVLQRGKSSDTRCCGDHLLHKAAADYIRKRLGAAAADACFKLGQRKGLMYFGEESGNGFGLPRKWRRYFQNSIFFSPGSGPLSCRCGADVDADHSTVVMSLESALFLQSFGEEARFVLIVKRGSGIQERCA